MNNLPEFFTGAISHEYGELSMKGGKAGTNPTETCGSDCSGHADCNPDETCPTFRKKDKDKDKDKYKKKAFFPVVEGWNEPPAAQL
jgi:hypothetical protein